MIRGLALLMSLCSTAAYADKAMFMVVADSPTELEFLRVSGEEELRHQGLAVLSFSDAVVEQGLDPAEVESCLDAAAGCMKVAARSADVDKFVVVSVGPRDVPARKLIGWLYDAREGTLLQRSEEDCATCGTAEGLDAAVIKMAAMLSAKAPEGPGPGSAAPAMDVVADKPSAGPSSLWAWTLAGAGAVSLGLGIVWLVVDGEQIEDQARQPEKRETLIPGIAAITAGLACSAASGYIFYRIRESRAVSVSPLANGALVNVAGSF